MERKYIEGTLDNGDKVRIKSETVGVIRYYGKNLKSGIVTVFGEIEVTEGIDNLSEQMGGIKGTKAGVKDGN